MIKIASRGNMGLKRYRAYRRWMQKWEKENRRVSHNLNSVPAHWYKEATK